MSKIIKKLEKQEGDAINKKALKSKKKFEKIMKDKKITFLEAVWEYFLSIDVIKRLKHEYISQLNLKVFEDEIEELNDVQIKLVKTELKKKIREIKTSKYDSIFEKVFREEVQQEIEMSKEYGCPDKEFEGFVLGGMVPDEYLKILFDSYEGVIFYYNPNIIWDENKPILKLDIDNGEIEWQPFG